MSLSDCARARWHIVADSRHACEGHYTRSGHPDLREWFAKHGGEPLSMTQPEFARFVLSESENAAQINRAAGSKPR